MWQLTNDAARLELPRFAAAVDLLNPARGLIDPRVDGSMLAGFQPLCVELPRLEPSRAAAQVECYVRGRDLVAAYADCPQPAMRAEVYWRVDQPESDTTIATVELVVSVQTSLLDSRPRVWTHSALPAAEVLRLSDVAAGRFVTIERAMDSARATGVVPHCYLFRPKLAAFSYAEMVHPCDVPTTESQPELSSNDDPHAPAFGGWRLRHQLFAESLEKGVILRARVVGLWIDRADDRAAVAAHYAAFVAAPPPLTR